ncbi:MAG: alpha/beta hydrolase [Clostridia bacterium]|nr:alpha/beta hydrolase [Clostridia bacterium]
MLFFGISTMVLAIFLLFFIFGHFIFIRACRRRKAYSSDHHEHGRGHGLSEAHFALIKDARTWFDAQRFEEVSVPSHDGLCLRGKLLPCENARGAVLFFHGYHSSARRDFSIQARALHEAGYHLLLVSERAHGESSGKYLCFGTKERYDVQRWAEFAEQRFGELPLALFGLSMGGASVLTASSLALPATVRAVISDCGFSSPWEIIIRTLRRSYKIYPYPVVYFMNFWARTLAGFDFRECSVKDSLKATSLPVLLIHGEEDRFVPTEMSVRAHESSPERTELFLVADARHGQAILFATEEYLRRLVEFLEKHL